jgi:hypothetical protein
MPYTIPPYRNSLYYIFSTIKIDLDKIQKKYKLNKIYGKIIMASDILPPVL